MNKLIQALSSKLKETAELEEELNELQDSADRALDSAESDSPATAGLYPVLAQVCMSLCVYIRICFYVAPRSPPPPRDHPEDPEASSIPSFQHRLENEWRQIPIDLPVCLCGSMRDIAVGTKLPSR